MEVSTLLINRLNDTGDVYPPYIVPSLSLKVLLIYTLLMKDKIFFKVYIYDTFFVVMVTKILNQIYIFVLRIVGSEIDYLEFV